VALVVCPPASPDGSDKKAFEARLLQLLDHLTPNTGYIRQLVFFFTRRGACACVD